MKVDRIYVSYMLRLWRVSCVDGAVWRASLECPQTGERLTFADPGQLIDFVRHIAEEQPQVEAGRLRPLVHRGK